MAYLTDKTCPTGKWEFDKEVANCFDAMLQASIPSYERMRELCYALGSQYITPRAPIVDIGASLGRAIEPFAKDASLNNTFWLHETSLAMLDKLYANPVFQKPNVMIRDTPVQYAPSLCTGKACLVLSVLTLQFIPVEQRPALLRKIFLSMNQQGAFLMVEKVMNTDSDMDRLFIDTYHRMKAGNGYSETQIEAKRKSLSGVLMPLTAEWNERMLRDAGFTSVECFYRDLNFAGWIALKGRKEF